MTIDTHFLAYWRRLDAQRALLGRTPVALGVAWAAYRRVRATEAARLFA